MSKKSELGSKSQVHGKGGRSKGGKQLKQKKKVQPRKQQQPPQSAISTGSADLLRLSRAQASSGSFDKWLQVEYLPSDFKPAEENKQVTVVGARKRWYRRLRFDVHALLHSFSIAILIIWLSSLLIFALYLVGPCSPLAEQPSGHKVPKTENTSTTTSTATTIGTATTATTEVGTTESSSSSTTTTLTTESTKHSTEHYLTASEKTKAKPRSTSSSSQQQNIQLRHQLSHYKLGDGFARVKDIIFSSGGEDNDGNSKSRGNKLLSVHRKKLLLSSEHHKEELTMEDNLPSCVVLSVFAIANIGLATLLLAHLLLYLLHVVELLGVIFPWFALEIAYAACFVLVTFVLCVALSIMSPFSSTGAIVVLGNLQFFCGLIFCFNRYRQCRAGQLPQELDDDVDGDVIRVQPQLKNGPVMAAVHAAPPKGSAGVLGKKHSPKGGGGKQAGKSKAGKQQQTKVVYKKMFSKITPSSSSSASSAAAASSSSSHNSSKLGSSSQHSSGQQTKQSLVSEAKSKMLGSKPGSSIQQSQKQPLSSKLSARKTARIPSSSSSGLKSFKSKSMRKTGGGKSGGGGKRNLGGGKLDSAVEGNSLSICSKNNSSSSAAGSSLSDAK